MENSYDLKIMPSIPDTTSFSYATHVRIANPASITKWLLLFRSINPQGGHHEQVMKHIATTCHQNSKRTRKPTAKIKIHV